MLNGKHLVIPLGFLKTLQFEKGNRNIFAYSISHKYNYYNDTKQNKKLLSFDGIAFEYHPNKRSVTKELSMCDFYSPIYVDNIALH